MPKNNEIVEQSTEVMETVEANRGIGLGAVAVLGVAGVGGAVLWTKVLRPGLSWLRNKVNEAKDRRHGATKKPAGNVVEAIDASVE
jgi:hypothetical protein